MNKFCVRYTRRLSPILFALHNPNGNRPKHVTRPPKILGGSHIRVMPRKKLRFGACKSKISKIAIKQAICSWAKSPTQPAKMLSQSSDLCLDVAWTRRSVGDSLICVTWQRFFRLPRQHPLPLPHRGHILPRGICCHAAHVATSASVIVTATVTV